MHSTKQTLTYIYGIEAENEEQEAIETQNNVIVPEIEVDVSNAILDRIHDAVPDPLIEDNHYGVVHYFKILQILENVVIEQ